MKLKFFAVLTVLSSASLLHATAYNGQGVYTVGSGVTDYPTLGAFAADFTALSTGMTGDTTVTIVSDLTETTNPLLGAPTNGSTLYIKPQASQKPVVTFTKTTLDATAASGLAGNLVIGPRAYATALPANLTLASNFAAMKVVIDGSNTPNGTTRDLTFQNVATSPEINRFIINVSGDCDNTVIKNCKVISNTAGATDNIGIVFWHRYTTDGAPLNLAPDNCTVSNCDINTSVSVAPASANIVGIGVKCARIGAAATGTAITGLKVQNCDISASLRCLYLNDNAGGLVDGNRLKIQQSGGGGGQVIEAVKHDGSNAVLGWTMDVTRNTFAIDSQSTRGIHGAVSMGGGMTTAISATPGTVTNIANNFVTANCLTTSVSATTSIYHIVELEGNTLTGTFNVLHNSFDAEDWTAYTVSTADLDNLGAISTKATASNQFNGILNVRNNIVRIAEDRLKYFQCANTTGTNAAYNFDNNTIYRPNQPLVGSGIHFAELPYNTNLNDFAAWQATAHDSNSNQADPLVGAGTGKWISTSDLHFDADPGSTFQSATSVGATVDIDNQARPNGALEKGADEFYAVSSVKDWSIY